jgi:hypothetical protein
MAFCWEYELGLYLVGHLVCHWGRHLVKYLDQRLVLGSVRWMEMYSVDLSVVD